MGITQKETLSHFWEIMLKKLKKRFAMFIVETRNFVSSKVTRGLRSSPVSALRLAFLYTFSVSLFDAPFLFPGSTHSTIQVLLLHRSQSLLVVFLSFAWSHLKKWILNNSGVHIQYTLNLLNIWIAPFQNVYTGPWNNNGSTWSL